MNTVRLYKNPYPYPYYGDISNYKTVLASPRHQDLRSGYIDMQLTMDEIFAFNYLSFTRDGRTIYAWVENIEELSGNKLYRVHYATDAFRTYRNDLVLGTQYIVRSPNPTLLEDELLSSTDEHNNYNIKRYNIGNPSTRYCVVQTRPPSLSNSASNTPGQPTPYSFYFAEYSVRNWRDSGPIFDLLNRVMTGAKPSNIVSLYTIPYVDTSQLTKRELVVKQGEDLFEIPGWYWMNDSNIYSSAFTNVVHLDIPDDLTLTKHSINLLFPEAGVMKIPSDLLYKEGLCVRRDIDVFTGACNYMLALDDGLTPTNISVRGGALSDIPILSDPFDTYISQNQNTLKAALIGDVANLTFGAVSGNMASVAMSGKSLYNMYTSLADAQNAIPSNPPAFMGSALVGTFNNYFYQIEVTKPYDNEQEVRERYGYPQHRIGKLTIPKKGFIQTQNCSVSSNGSVPLWAINEINQLFNAGILFK